MDKKNKIGYVFGNTSTRYINIINQVSPYIQSEYLTIKDELQGDLTCEVIETKILPFAHNSVLPDGCITNFVKNLKLDEFRPIFLAKAKILNEIPYPVMPNSKVLTAEYDEISNIIVKANPKDSMVLGIIKGTELSQDELPEDLKNIAPLWDSGSAVNQKGIPLLLNHHKLREYPHIGLFGSSGSGKSFALRVICEELMKLKIPGICLDPHHEIKFEGFMKGLSNEFHSDFSDSYQEFTIGKNVGIRFEDLNVSELESLFDFIDPLTEPQKNALEVLYEKGMTFKNLQKHINDLKEAFDIMDVKGKKGKFSSEETALTPSQTDLYNKNKSKVSGSVSLQALAWKCVSLEKTKIFTNDITGIKKAMKGRKLAVVRGDILRLQMISSYLISKLYKARRKYIDEDGDYFPPFFTIVDEAHNFAQEGGKGNPTKFILRKIGQEARKYGVFLIACTQRPRNLDNTLLAQLNTKFIFRLTDQNDMQIAKVEGNLTNGEVSRLPDLPSGNCFVSSAILNKTYPVRFRTTFSKAPNVKDPFEELQEEIGAIEEALEGVLISFLPLTGIMIGKKLKDICDSYGQRISVKEIVECLDGMAKKKIISKETDLCGVKYTSFN